MCVIFLTRAQVLAACGGVSYENFVFTCSRVNFAVTDIVVGVGLGECEKFCDRFAAQTYKPIVKFQPDFDGFGKTAHLLNNQRMVNYADAAIIIWDGKSYELKDLFKRAHKKGLELALFKV